LRCQIGISKIKDEELAANGEVLLFDGFLKVYLESSDDDEEGEPDETKEGMLPPLKMGQNLDVNNITANN